MFHGQNNWSDSNLRKLNLLKKKNRKYMYYIYALQENIQGNSPAA